MLFTLYKHSNCFFLSVLKIFIFHYYFLRFILSLKWDTFWLFFKANNEYCWIENRRWISSFIYLIEKNISIELILYSLGPKIYKQFFMPEKKKGERVDSWSFYFCLWIKCMRDIQSERKLSRQAQETHKQKNFYI